MNQKRWQSVPMWTAVITQVISLLILTNVINLEEAEVIKMLALGILNMLTLFGVVNSPTTKGAL